MRRRFRSHEGDAVAARRRSMVEHQLRGRGLTDQQVLGAMDRVAREHFVTPDMTEHAYDDNALPIGHGQTISQPYIVARMTSALDLPAWQQAHPGQPPRVLDVGTGSGYQAAVLAEMGAEVVSIERDAALAEQARDRLAGLGYDVRVLVGDGSLGAPEYAPFSGIIVAAAAPTVPQPLTEQLADGGRLVVPVGDRYEQRIVLVRRVGGEVVVEPLEAAVFVPLTGEHGFPER